jgi:hypothetical protein
MKYTFEGGKNLKLAYTYPKQSSRKCTWITVINFRYKSYSFHEVYKSPYIDRVRIEGTEVMSCLFRRNVKIVLVRKPVATVTFEERESSQRSDFRDLA